jgi:hypothetical protein
VTLRNFGYEQAGVAEAWAVARRGVASFGLPNTVVIDHHGNFLAEISGAHIPQIRSVLERAMSQMNESK